MISLTGVAGELSGRKSAEWPADLLSGTRTTTAPSSAATTSRSMRAKPLVPLLLIVVPSMPARSAEDPTRRDETQAHQA